MNENLKTKITRKLDDLPDEMGRQLLDYMEFLDSRYNLSRRAPSTVQRIAEGLEDKIGSVRLSEAAAKSTAQVVDAASSVIEGLAAAGRAVADELTPEPPGKKEEEEGEAGGAASEEDAGGDETDA
jgi:hypothetical protein